MNKQRKTSHILNVFQYDADGHVVLPASLTLGIVPGAEDNSGKVPSTAWVRGLVSTTGSSLVPTSRSITINGTSYDLSSNRSWSIDTGVLTASAGSGISVSVVNQNLNIVNTGLLTGTAGAGISVSTVNQNLNIVNTGLLTSTAGAGISVSTVNQNLNIVNTGLLTASSGLGISVSTVGQNLNIVNTGILTASAGSGISVSVVGQNLNIVNSGILTATAGAGISLSVVDGNLNIVNTITNNNQLTNGAGYATTSYVTTQINNLVAGAPGLLDTLDELAAALGDDANFATTTATSLGNRLRIDIGTQGLTSTQQGYGRTNLGLGTAALSATGDFATAAQGTKADTAFGWGNHASAGYQSASTAITTSNIGSQSVSYATTAGSLSSMNISQFTNNSGYITGYSETDTLATVTARGASTSSNLTFSGQLTLNKNGTQLKISRADTAAADWFFHSWASGLNIYPNAVGTVYFGRDGSATNVDVYNGTLYQQGNPVLHTGNYTSYTYSTSDADNRFLRGTTNPGTVNNFTISIGNNGSYSYVQSHSSQPLYLNPVGNSVFIGSGSTVLHSSNYDSYSPTLTGGGASGTWGISITGNAATLGGYSPNQTGGAYTIVQRDSNGYIQNSYFYTSGGGSERGTGISYIAGFNSSDYYIRSYTLQGLASAMSGATMNISGNSSSTSQRSFDYLYTTSYLESAGGVYGTIFYDNNDRAYYLNPAGGSRLRNLYVGDSGDDWSDPGGWGTQVRFSNGPHVKFVLHARTPGIEAGMYVHTPGSVYIGSYTSHSVSMMYAGNRRMLIEDGRIYTDVYLEAAGSVRAPIFYDSNDTGYYVDPAGTSNLNKFSEFTMAYNGMNPMSASSPYAARYAGSTQYRNGTMGNGSTDFNVMASNWGSGFIDSWSSPGTAPGGSSHYVGLQGFHYNHQNNYNWYGFQMACAGEADNKFFWRSAWPTPRSWVEMIHSGNIGAQSVSYASNAGTASNSNTVGGIGVSTLRGGISSNNYDFYVNGDANTYYPVVLSLGGQYGMHRYSISRGYSDPAPWDPIGTGSHRGGLTLTFDCSSDIAWGGNDKSWRIIQFAEQYTNMVAGMALPVTDGIIVWLRGGGAYYRFHGPSGINHGATVYYSGYTAANGAFYGVRTSLGSVDGEIRAKWPIRGYGDGDMYVNNQVVLNTGNRSSYIDTLYYSGSQRLWTGSDGTRNSGWAYHQDNNTGIHWPNNGWHFYPKDNWSMYVRSGSSSESAIVLNTAGTNRGYVYANSSNEVGFLNNSGNWILKMTSGGDMIMDYNYGNSIVGVYSSYRFQGVFSMGNAYKLAIDGTSPGNLYGMSWSHPNAGGQATRLNDHGLMVMINGVTQSAFSSNIWAAGDITAYSDIRVKTNIKSITDAVKKVQNIRGVTFTRTDMTDTTTRHAGVIAQEILEVLPEVVTKDGNGHFSVAYGNLNALLIEAIKEQQKQIEELQNKLDNVLSNR